MRVSSPAIAAAFIDGVREQGTHVVDYGMLRTDVMYFAVVNDGLEGGAQITASHNPKQYNGIKMVRAEALPLSGDAGIGDIRDMIAADRLPPPAATPGRLTTRDIVPTVCREGDVVHRPVDHQAVQRRARRRQRDGGPGGAAAVRPAALQDHEAVLRRSTARSRTTRPIRSSKRTAATSPRKSIRQKADIGIAWDGDADRCFFIDGSGEFISGDFITALLAEAFLLKHPGRRSSTTCAPATPCRDTVARYGGRALMNRVGHAFIKQRMRQEDGIFAGEVTGHYYFRDFYYADNGFIPALLILELMSKKNQSLRELLQPFRERYFISGEINTKLASMDEVPKKLAAIEARYKDAADREDGRRLGRLSRLALQRPRLEHRAAAAPEPRGDDAGD